MKIVFIVISSESLATEYLSSYLKKNGHETEIIFDSQVFAGGVFRTKAISKFFDIKHEIAKEIISKKPDIVGISVFSANYQRSLVLAKEIKKLSPSLPIIFGGIHPTSVPEVVIKENCVDMVCVGEGEEALSELLDSYKNGKPDTSIKNIWFKQEKHIIKNPIRPLIDNLDKFPFPDKVAYYQTQPKYIQNEYWCISSRGCPFSCSYCGNSVYQDVYRGIGRHNRRRSPENLIEELVIAKKTFHPKKIIFVDDVFAQDEKWLEKFVILYRKKIHLPYFALTHATFLTYKIAKLLKKSGCFLVEFGIQTASESTRTKILNRYEKNEQIKKAAEICHQVGIPLGIDHIFNLPGETTENQLESLKFYNELRPCNIFYFDLLYYPKTKIADIAFSQKIISKKQFENINQGIVPLSSSNPTDTNIEILFNLIPIFSKRIIDKIIEKKLYIPPFKLPKSYSKFVRVLILLTKHLGINYIKMIKNITEFTFETHHH